MVRWLADLCMREEQVLVLVWLLAYAAFLYLSDLASRNYAELRRMRCEPNFGVEAPSTGTLELLTDVVNILRLYIYFAILIFLRSICSDRAGGSLRFLNLFYKWLLGLKVPPLRFFPVVSGRGTLIIGS